MTSFDPDLAWRRSPSVVLRPEPFGALAYDFGSRRLSFLKDIALVRVVEALDESASVSSALDSVGVAEADRPRHLAALGALARAGMITASQEAIAS